MRRLLLTMPPGARKRPLDYLSRLAWRNGHGNVRYLGADFGIKARELRARGDDAIHTIADLGSGDFEALRIEAFVGLSENRWFAHKAQEPMRRLPLPIPLGVGEDTVDAPGRWARRNGRQDPVRAAPERVDAQ